MRAVKNRRDNIQCLLDIVPSVSFVLLGGAVARLNPPQFTNKGITSRLGDDRMAESTKSTKRNQSDAKQRWITRRRYHVGISIGNRNDSDIEAAAGRWKKVNPLTTLATPFITPLASL